MRRSTLLAGAVVVLLALLGPVSQAAAAPHDARAVTAAADTSRRAAFARVCTGNAATPACDRFLAPLACSPANPFARAPFSCQYLLGIHPCHADPSSNLCQLFVANYCFERPDSVACFVFRADSGRCRSIADAGIAPPSPTCALFAANEDCPIVEPDGSPPPSPQCRLYAAAFLDYCQQRAASGACDNPYGGAEEGLDFVTKTRPCPRKKRRRHRICRASASATAAAAPAAPAVPEPQRVSPWPFSTITYYLGETRADGSIGPAPRAWAIQMAKAFSAWTAAHAGWTFRRAATPSRADADVIALAATRRKGSRCVGVSGRGFGYAQARLAVGATCLTRGALALATAHEIGHVLGLPHDTKACSAMNPDVALVGGRPRPSRCETGSALVRPADVRAARALLRAPVGAAAPCDPGGGELPLFAQDFACKYTVTCAGARGRNLFDEAGTVVIDAEIAAHCKRVLRVASLDVPSTGAPSFKAAGRFTGTSSQGRPVGFTVRAGVVRDLDVAVHFQCTDNTSQFGNSIVSPKPSPQEAGLLGSLGLGVVDRRVNGDETIGPFPPLATSAHGFRASLEPPNDSAIYDVQGTLRNGTWTGSVRIVEGWHASPLGLIPDPDGEVVCDTGPVGFTARASR